MSQRDERRLTSFAQLAGAWPGIAPIREPREPRAPLERPPHGDLPICPCGKVCYESKEMAAELYPNHTAYACPLGHAVYHLKSRGRSARERGMAT